MYCDGLDREFTSLFFKNKNHQQTTGPEMIFMERTK